MPKTCPCCNQPLPPELAEGKPITRVSLMGHDGEVTMSLMSVEELMDENAGYEDSAWVWIQSMLDDGNGIYDDSDYRSNVVVWYIAQNKYELALMANRWLKANFDQEQGFELEPVDEVKALEAQGGD